MQLFLSGIYSDQTTEIVPNQAEVPAQNRRTNNDFNNGVKITRRRLGSDRNWCFQSQHTVQSQLPQSQAHRLTGSEIACKMALS